MGGDIQVLVVDDQPRFRAVASMVVERTSGFAVQGEAEDGAAALAAIAAQRPDLVLMDIHMPVIDGVEATRRISAEWPDVMVVLLSSYAKTDLPDGVAEAGAADYLHKEDLGPAALRDLWQRHRRPT